MIHLNIILVVIQFIDESNQSFPNKTKGSSQYDTEGQRRSQQRKSFLQGMNSFTGLVGTFSYHRQSHLWSPTSARTTRMPFFIHPRRTELALILLVWSTFHSFCFLSFIRFQAAKCTSWLSLWDWPCWDHWIFSIPSLNAFDWDLSASFPSFT